MPVAAGRGRHVVRAVALLAVAGRLATADAGRLAQRLAQQPQARAAQRLHRPLGFSQEVLGRLRVGVDGRAEAGQGLAPRLGQQPHMPGRALLAMPYVRKQRTLLAAVLINARHR
jgi:anti-sigma factor RsiW